MKDVILRSNLFDLRVISLATSARDSASLRLLSPASWRVGAQIQCEEWQGLPVWHVGASLVEFEIQRYRPRAALRTAVSDCDLLQVVAGSPAWACVAEGMSQPLSIHCATLASVERRRRDLKPVGLVGYWRKAMTTLAHRMDIRGLQIADSIQVMNGWLLEYVT